MGEGSGGGDEGAAPLPGAPPRVGAVAKSRYTAYTRLARDWPPNAASVAMGREGAVPEGSLQNTPPPGASILAFRFHRCPALRGAGAAGGAGGAPPPTIRSARLPPVASREREPAAAILSPLTRRRAMSQAELGDQEGTEFVPPSSPSNSRLPRASIRLRST